MEAAKLAETLVSYHITTWCHIPLKTKSCLKIHNLYAKGEVPVTQTGIYNTTQHSEQVHELHPPSGHTSYRTVNMVLKKLTLIWSRNYRSTMKPEGSLLSLPQDCDPEPVESIPLPSHPISLKYI